MEELDIKHIWKNSSKEVHINVDTEHLLQDFKVGMEDRERIVRKRDQREIIAAIIGMLGFGYSFYAYSNTISAIGSVIGVISLMYIIYKLRSNRKSKFTQELFLPIQKQLMNQKQFMTRQVKLLNTVLYWASIPLFCANALIFWGVSSSEKSLPIIEQITAKWEIKVIMTLIFAGIFLYIGLLNKKAARVNWRPLIQKIDAILEHLKKEKN